MWARSHVCRFRYDRDRVSLLRQTVTVNQRKGIMSKDKQSSSRPTVGLCERDCGRIVISGRAYCRPSTMSHCQPFGVNLG